MKKLIVIAIAFSTLCFCCKQKKIESTNITITTDTVKMYDLNGNYMRDTVLVNTQVDTVWK